MEKNLKIEKLSDIVEWADGMIRDGGYNEEKYRSDATTAYCNVKAYELWRIRDAALKGMERHSVYTNALNEDIASRDSKIKRLEKEIEGRKECCTSLKELMDTKYISIDEHNMINKSLEEKVEIYEKEIERLNRYTTNLDKVNHDLVTKVTLLESELADCKVKNRHQKENLDGINKTLETRTKEKESLINVKNSQEKEIEAHEAENKRLTEKITSLKGTITELSHDIDNYKSWNASLHKDIKELKKELNETCTTKELDLKGHNRREMALANELADKNDEIKDLKESINRLTMHCRAKNTEIARLTKENADIRHEHAKITAELEFKKEEDDHGREGFEEYIKYIINEEEGKFKEELNKRFSEEVSKISQKRTEEELAKVKLNEKYGHAGEIAFRIRSEVDKKRIVDIGEGAEKILGVSRELFDAAIKALVDDGYQEIIGRIPQATNSYVYMDMHVLATPDVETKETVNAENIKSLDFDIPCGEDAIE